MGKRPSHVDDLVFLKLGGSLITDKKSHQTEHAATIQRVATEIAAALEAKPEMKLLIGHGAGSFGHLEARNYGTRAGVHSATAWIGFAEVATVVGRLNRIVLEALRDAGVPAMAFQPSASASARDTRIEAMAWTPIREALSHGLVPVVHGDVAFDATRGGTIISTEDIFSYLAAHLQPGRILLAGIEAGVLTEHPAGELVSEITLQSWQGIRAKVRGSAAPDVTGGMESKVAEMLALCAPGRTIRIFAGTKAGLVQETLAGSAAPGTLLRSTLD